QLIQQPHLHPRLHITALGSAAAHQTELAPKALAQVDHYVADRLSQTRVLGELHHALRAGAVSDQAEFSELGQIIAGQRPGRVSDQQVTLCDLTGTGAQDTAIANLAFERAVAASKGLAFLS